MKDTAIETLAGVVRLTETQTLELGCGDGEAYSTLLVERGARLLGIDPDLEALRQAGRLRIQNASFQEGRAEKLDLPEGSFDLVLFSSSLHHVGTKEEMLQALSEAIRVCAPGGYIAVIEPQIFGSMHDAQRIFGVGNGDEREARHLARKALNDHPGLRVVRRLHSEAEFRVEGHDDFVESLHPTRNLNRINRFLDQQPSCRGGGHQLLAPHDVLIYQPN